MAQLGLHSLAVTPLWKPEEADQFLPKVRDAGTSVLEIPLLDPLNFDSSGTRAAMERNGLALVCSLGLPAALSVTRDLATACDFLDHVLRRACDAGASALSGVTYGTIGQVSGAAPTAAEHEAICRLVDHVAGTARGMGMRLGLEPCNRYETHLLNTAAQTVRIIERVGAQNVFVHLDTYHMNIEEAGWEEGFADAGEHLGYLHLSESNRGVPGRGTLDWPAIFTALSGVGYDGVMTLESFVHVAPEIAAGLAIWRPVAQRPDDVVETGLPFLADAARAAGIDVARP